MIVGNFGSIPPTFRFDVVRIANLRMEFKLLQKQTACAQVFVDILKGLGWRGPTSSQAYTNILKRICVIASFDQSEACSDTALEIVRAAHELTGNKHLPGAVLLKATANALLQRENDETEVFRKLHNALCHNLIELVNREMAAMEKKTSLQMLKYFDTTPSSPPAIVFCGTTSRISGERVNVCSVAKRIAHIAILHWRVWAPILYQKPSSSIRKSASLSKIN